MKNKYNTQIEYPYMAGYIDGDGCFYIGFERIGKRHKSITSINITSVNKDILDHFYSIFGGSVHVSSTAHANQKTLYQFALKKNESIKTMHKILLYLVEKREQCLTALRFADTQDIITKKLLASRMKTLKCTHDLVSKSHIDEFMQFRYTIKPTLADYAYLAGFIDAECCFGIQKHHPRNRPNTTYKILLQCNNTKAPIFKWLIERFGGFLNFVDRLKCRKAKKNQICWRLCGKSLAKHLPIICSFLKYKQPVCKELIRFYNTTLPNGGARHTEVFRQQYAAILQVREEIVSNIHKLNSKGIRL